MNCMDLHAVGAEVKNVVRKAKRKRSGKPTPPQKIEYLPARWHCVVPHPFALENNSKAPIRNGVLPAGWKMMFLRNIKIKSPHNNQIITKVSCLCSLLLSSDNILDVVRSQILCSFFTV